jgi:hypothetical protein
MAISSHLYKLASPYDAYVSHVSDLHGAIGRIRSMSERALGYEAGLQSSERLVPGGLPADERVQMFRKKLGDAADSMSDEQFEDFLSHVGGGEVANVEADRAQTVARMSRTTRGIEEYFAIAAKEIHTLETRGYNPKRADVARQLRENNLPSHTTTEFKKILHELGKSVGVRA